MAGSPGVFAKTLNRACPRCGGRLHIEDDGDIVCITCGYREVIKGKCVHRVIFGEPLTTGTLSEMVTTVEGKCSKGCGHQQIIKYKILELNDYVRRSKDDSND